MRIFVCVPFLGSAVKRQSFGSEHVDLPHFACLLTFDVSS